MRQRTFLLGFIFIAVSFALPLAAHAGIPFFGPIIPDAVNRCAAGWGGLIQVVNNIISLLITLAIVFVAPLMIAYAGFLFVVNPVNSGGISEARGILTHTIVGIVIALAGWMIVNALMVALYNPGADVNNGGKIGMWSKLITSGGEDFCLIQEGALTKLNQAKSSPGITGISATGVITTGGNTLVNISAAANAYIGMSTATGPDKGNLACAWAVNNILKNAGVQPIDGNGVQEMENVLQSGRGTRIDNSMALPGDLIIEAGTRHVGICQNAGCTQVISNSSSKASFSFSSGPDFRPAYKAGLGRVYRVNN